jgi:inner membrane protein
MDNITHTLAGLLGAEAVVRWRARGGQAPSVGWIRLAYLGSALGNNLPDFDFAYTWITGGQLGYLMHHRGHTHTLPVGVILGLLVAGMLVRWGLRKGWVGSRPDRVWLVALTVFGPVLHVSMDASNVYGVHPFWPLYSGWLYGDSIFILEPLFWLSTIPPLLFATRWRPGRLVLLLLIVSITVGAWLTDLVTPPARWTVTLGAPLSLLLASRLAPWPRALVGVGLSTAVLVLFVVTGRIARAHASAAAAEHFPDDRVHDVAQSPFPANPWCWWGTIIQTTPDGRFVERRYIASSVPGWVQARECPRFTRPLTAPLVEVPAPGNARLQWYRQFEAPLSELGALARNCQAQTYLRFARAPFWKRPAPGQLIMGDVRFDRSDRIDFAELELSEPPAECPRLVPGWLPPRRALW